MSSTHVYLVPESQWKADFKTQNNVGFVLSLTVFSIPTFAIFQSVLFSNYDAKNNCYHIIENAGWFAFAQD